MSVCLKTLKGQYSGTEGDFDDVEVMAPDYDCTHVWLWDTPMIENRIDLSRDQLRELRTIIDEVLAK